MCSREREGVLRPGERRSLCWIALVGLALAGFITATAFADLAARHHLVASSGGMNPQTTYEDVLVVLAFVAAGYLALVGVITRELWCRRRDLRGTPSDLDHP